MYFQLIRNATSKIVYEGIIFLTDPVLSPKFTFESFAGNSKNPTVDLPFNVSKIINGIDAVILSHLHIDHFDKAAQEALRKNLTVFCQVEDQTRILRKGFQTTKVIKKSIIWEGIKITRINGLHGSGNISKKMGIVSGYVFQSKNEPTVYWAGDTILCDAVKQAIAKFQPDIIITHSCGAKFSNSGPIIMDAEQTIELCSEASNAIPESVKEFPDYVFC